mmetsp:Transcript_12556/g.45151  ORF Transcript_12556/g.45151 Transcript_12556/m.45151 type:complete len:278 (-) Transcript_12556:82-915(-)
MYDLIFCAAAAPTCGHTVRTTSLNHSTFSTSPSTTQAGSPTHSAVFLDLMFMMRRLDPSALIFRVLTLEAHRRARIADRRRPFHSVTRRTITTNERGAPRASCAATTHVRATDAKTRGSRDSARQSTTPSAPPGDSETDDADAAAAALPTRGSASFNAAMAAASARQQRARNGPAGPRSATSSSAHASPTIFSLRNAASSPSPSNDRHRRRIASEATIATNSVTSRVARRFLARRRRRAAAEEKLGGSERVTCRVFADGVVSIAAVERAASRRVTLQ